MKGRLCINERLYSHFQVMEQATDAEKAMAVSEFLDYKRKNKVHYSVFCFVLFCFVFNLRYLLNVWSLIFHTILK